MKRIKKTLPVVRLPC